MTKNDFSGVAVSNAPDFALGVVRGSRAFDVDSLGRLTGVTHRTVWTPGENLAECKARKDDGWVGQMKRKAARDRAIASGVDPLLYDLQETAQSFRKGLTSSSHGGLYPSFASMFKDLEQHFLWGTTTLKEPDPDLDPFLSLDHAAIKKAAEDHKEKLRIEAEEKARKEAELKELDLLEHCDHGFHAYYEGSNDYGDSHDRVNGVIEGYGETVIGTRGFRSMKARIVALHIPKKISPRERALVTRNYAGIPMFKSFNQMVSEYPGENGGVEYDPNTDPDFWTRTV